MTNSYDRKVHSHAMVLEVVYPIVEMQGDRLLFEAPRDDDIRNCDRVLAVGGITEAGTQVFSVPLLLVDKYLTDYEAAHEIAISKIT